MVVELLLPPSCPYNLVLVDGLLNTPSVLVLFVVDKVLLPSSCAGRLKKQHKLCFGIYLYIHEGRSVSCKSKQEKSLSGKWLS